MAKKKVSNRPSPQKDFKRLMLIVVIPLITLTIILVSFLIWLGPSFPLLVLFGEMTSKNKEHNPAKYQAEIMIPFAQQNNLQKIYEYNGARGIDNRTSWYMLIYQGTQSTNTMHTLVKNHMEKSGYRIEEAFYTYNPDCNAWRTSKQGCINTPIYGATQNENQPYWVLKGKKENNDEVSIEISDKTYQNGANDAGEKFGENRVAIGKTVITTTFFKYSQ